MKVTVYSKHKMEAFLEKGVPTNTAVISFYNEPITLFSKPIDYTNKVKRFIQINLPDVDEHGLADYGYTADTFFSEAESLAAFIHAAHKEGFDFACQCQFGFSRSAACAAAIMEFFEGRGSEILLSEKYQPNKILYHKLLNALKKQAAK